MAKTTKTTTKTATSAKAAATGVATAAKPAKPKIAVTTKTASQPKAAETGCCGGACHTPTYEQISKRAYEIWVAKGYPQGQDLANWQQAEAELMKGSLVAA